MAIGAEQADDMMAAMLAPEGTRYTLICRECRHVWPYQRDCKTVKLAREGKATCPDCGDPIDVSYDSKEDE